MIQLLVMASIGASLFAGGYQLADRLNAATIAEMQNEAQEAKAQAIADAQAIEDLGRQITLDIATKHVEVMSREKQAVKIVTQEVIKYVQTDNATDCGLDDNGVRIHDLAASGRVSPDTDTTPESNGESISANNAEVLQTVTENYSTCRETAARLESLQDWVRQLGRPE